MKPMAKNFIFTITTGRSGTAYLAELLKANLQNAEVHHERLSFLGVSVDSPDASDFTYFNTIGNVKKVRDFWQRKLTNVQQSKSDIYVETSHFLAKAGLIENLSVLLDNPDNQVHIIVLKRLPHKIAWSFLNRFDFANTVFTWLSALDFRYHNVIINAGKFAKAGIVGHIYWYIYEMYTRAAYYQIIYKDIQNLHFHEVDLEQIAKTEGASVLLNALKLPMQTELKLPPKTNELPVQVYSEKEHKIVKDFDEKNNPDYLKIAKNFIAEGKTLAEPNDRRQLCRQQGYTWED